MFRFARKTIVAVALLAAVSFAGAAAAHAQETASTIPAMLPTSITAGYIDPAGKVPMLNGVSGSGVENLDISFPVAQLVHGYQYVYSVTVQDNTYSGSCTASYSLTQVQSVKTVTLDSAAIKTFTTAPGNVWVWVATRQSDSQFAGSGNPDRHLQVRHQHQLDQVNGRIAVAMGTKAHGNVT